MLVVVQAQRLVVVQVLAVGSKTQNGSNRNATYSGVGGAIGSAVGKSIFGGNTGAAIGGAIGGGAGAAIEQNR